jgi:hypothetical protein
MSLADQSTFLSFLTEQTSIMPSDFPYILLIALGYILYRVILSKILLQPLSTLVVNSDPKKQAQQRSKFVHRGFDLIHYLVIVFLGTLAAYFAPYGRCPFYFPGCASYSAPTRPGFICSRLEKVYHILFTAYYVADIPFLWTTTDVGLMSFHHAICLGLEFLTMLSGRTVILFSCNLLHDCVDVFLYAGKILTYLRFKKAADISLVIFAIAYLYLRLINYGIIIYSIWRLDVGEQIDYVGPYTVCKFLVFGLLICHFIWYAQVLKVVFDALSRGRKEIRDLRSDEGEKKKVE